MRAAQGSLALAAVLAACGPAPDASHPPPAGPTALAWEPPQPAAPPTALPPTGGARPAWALANLDPTDDRVVGPPAALQDCPALLAALGVRARPARLPVHREGASTCGTPEAVTYEAGPTGVAWSSRPVVTCAVAAGLARFEAIVHEEALRHLGSPPKRLEHLGSYACRKMVRFDLASEHSFANALDVRGVLLADGRRITVEADWGPVRGAPVTAGGRFLRAVARRTYDEAVFSVVLGPPWDALHHDHLHLDQARYRVDGLVVR